MVEGKVALVTGGGSGIGRATCQILAREGAKVVVTDVNLVGAEETVKSLSGDGHLALFMEVASKESVEAGIRAIKDQYQGPPTIGVNCAAIAIKYQLLDSTDDDYNKLMAINLKGTINVTKAVCQELVEAKLPGSIINISSVAVKGSETWSIYSATKGAVKSFSRSVAKEFGRYGIRCNIVFPGCIDTPMIKVADKNMVDWIINSLPISRVGKPEEVGEVITFLASDKSSYMTGACVDVSGGL